MSLRGNGWLPCALWKGCNSYLLQAGKEHFMEATPGGSLGVSCWSSSGITGPCQAQLCLHDGGSAMLPSLPMPTVSAVPACRAVRPRWRQRHPEAVPWCWMGQRVPAPASNLRYPASSSSVPHWGWCSPCARPSCLLWMVRIPACRASPRPSLQAQLPELCSPNKPELPRTTPSPAWV